MTRSLLLVALLVLSLGCQSDPPPPPNIILFFVDDMGWQDTSVPFHTEPTPFNERYQTPHMERLAREGMLFRQAYATAVCSPTRVSLMTGLNAARHRVTNWTLMENQSSDAAHATLDMPPWRVNGLSPFAGVEAAVHADPLPLMLQQAGYTTIHVGKAHLGAKDTPGADPFNLGFDVNIAGHYAGAPGSYLATNAFSAAWRNGGRHWDVPGLDAYHGEDLFLTEVLTREALTALDSVRTTDKPFFLYMAHYAVHTPIEADERFTQPYRDAGLEETEARYAGMVEGMDKSLGDLMTYLDTHGLEDNTIILFMSDNGGLSAVARGGTPHTHNLPLSSGKGSAHEGGIREPMLVKWPGVVPANSVANDYLIIEDFFPTILEMAGVTDYRTRTIQPIDGISFMPLLTGEGTYPQDRPLFWHYPNNWGPTGPGIGASSSVRQGDWKLIYYHADQSFELFNLYEDLGETTNRAATETAVRDSLARILGEHLQFVHAQMPIVRATGQTVPYPDRVIEATP